MQNIENIFPLEIRNNFSAYWTEQKSAAQSNREYGIKDSVLSRWKQEFIERSPGLFEQGAGQDDRDQRIAELERMVGRLATELEMSKKVSRFLDLKRR